MVTLIAFVPLIFCLTFVLVGYAQFSFIQLSSANICRKTLLSGQDQIKNEVSKLLKMNIQAKILRRQRKLADTAMRIAKASKNPAAISVALIALNVVRTKQIVFAAKQKLTRFNANKISSIYKNNFKHKMKKLSPNVKIKISDFPFAVEKVQEREITPDYRLKNYFSDQQKASARWEIRNFNLSFINPFINLNRTPAIQGYCGASLRKKGGLWRAYLIKKEAL